MLLQDLQLGFGLQPVGTRLGEFEPQLSRRRRVALGLLCGPKPMPLTICEYRGHRISLLTSDAGCTALVHKSGAILAFARSSRKEGLRVAFEKARAMIDKAYRENAPQDALARSRQRGIDRPRH